MYYPEIEFLRSKGYTVEQKSPWHFHILGKKTYVNVWPTKRKWMVAYDSGASFYNNAQDLLQKVHNILGKKRNPRWLIDRLLAEQEAARTDEDRQAERVWREQREKLSTYLRLA